MSGKRSTFQIWQNYPAPVGFLPEPDFCRIWKKCRIPAGAGAEIRYRPIKIQNFEINRRFTSLILEVKANFTSVNRLVCCF